MSLWGNDNKVWRSCDYDGRAEIKAGNAVNIHGRYWIGRERWHELEPWERDRLRTLAVGLHAHSAVVVGRSAGLLWNLKLLGYGSRVEMARLGGQSAESNHGAKAYIRYRATRFLPGDIIHRKGITFTSLNRTLIDICRWEGFICGLIAMESAFNEGYSIEGIRKLASAMKGMHGMKHFWKVIKYAQSKSESPAESYAYATMIEAEIDITMLQHNLEIEIGQETFRPDFLYGGWLLIEIDGEIKYTGKYGDAGQTVHAERHRENILRNEGYDTLRTSWNDISSGTFIRQLKAKIAERERRLNKR